MPIAIKVHTENSLSNFDDLFKNSNLIVTKFISISQNSIETFDEFYWNVNCEKTERIKNKINKKRIYLIVKQKKIK